MKMHLGTMLHTDGINSQLILNVPQLNVTFDIMLRHPHIASILPQQSHLAHWSLHVCVSQRIFRVVHYSRLMS